MRYIHRKIEKKLLSAVKQFSAIALTGPRQSGKSTLLQNVLGKKYKYITFDDPLIRERCLGDPKLFLEELGEKLILDEIQYVPDLLSYLKIAIDKKRHKRGQYILTGSQQFHLIRNLGDTLAGRVCLLTLLPFNIQEIASARRNKKMLPTKESFLQSCLSGSFPELMVKPRLNVENWYASYIQTYLERDVRGIYGVGSLLDFQRFMKLLAGRCAQILNLSSFASDLGVAVSTIKTWLSILSANQIIYLLPPYYKNFGKRIIKSPKVYFTDCGLVAYFLGLRTRELLLYGPLAGALFENYIIQETLKIFYNKGQQPELYYYRTHKGAEIDLLIPQNSKIIPFEIKMTDSLSKEMVANIMKVTNISPDFRKTPAGLVSLSKEAYRISQSVRIYNLTDFFAELEAY